MCVRESERPPTSRRPETAEKNGEWTAVKRRIRKSPSTITSFFIYNLPSTITNLKLKELFQDHGEISDAYIPNKKDKYDNMYGFVRFRNLRDPQTLLPRLQDIRYENLILNVSLAKSDKLGNTINHPPNTLPKQKPYLNHKNPYPSRNPSRHPPPPSSQNFFNPPPQNSYRDKLTNQPFPTPPSPPSINLSNLNPKSPNAWKKVSIIASVRDFSTLTNPENFLNDPALKTAISLSYVGGLSVLLGFNASTIAKDFIQSKKAFLQKWFTTYEVWNGQDIIVGRIVRVNIFGMPLPLWDKESFDMVALVFGRILEKSTANCNDPNLSSGTVTIITDSYKKVDGIVKILYGNKSFLTRVTEDGSFWRPNLLETFSIARSSDSGNAQSENSYPEVNMNDPSSHSGNCDTLETPKGTSLNHTPLKSSTAQKIPSLSPKNKHAESTRLNHSPQNHTPLKLGPHLHNTPPSKPNSHACSNLPPFTPINPINLNHNVRPPPPPPAPPPPPSTSDHHPPAPTPSRKRQRCISPVHNEPNQPEFHSPPRKPLNPLETNTAPALLNKRSEFSSRIGPPPIPFETLLNQECPPPSPHPLPEQNVPSILPLPTNNDCISLAKEVKDTIEIGECVGIHLAEHEELVTELLHRSRVNNPSQ